MSETVYVKKDLWDAADSQDDIAPGEYQVRVKRVNHSDPEKIGVLYEIISEDKSMRNTFWDNFCLEYKKGMKMLRELLNAIDVTTEDNSDAGLVGFEPSQCIGKTLSVTVEHREDNGKTYVNVTQHLPF